ncbi:hypothetical protein [Actinomadura napierensis]|uniref:Uncharacterized protein n=1 Tax=Actinomadura napierensis TaxID=267854 RepID=A0ABN3AFY9_9ACTN
MEPLAIQRLLPLAKAAWRFTQEPTMHQVLTAIADAQGRTAARALEDAAASTRPELHLQVALTELCSAYEKYYTRGQNHPSSPAEWVQVLFHAKRAARSRFNAAFLALTIAYICRALRDEPLVEEWRQRGRKLFEESYRELVSIQPGTLVPSFGLPGSSNSIYIGEEDEARYRSKLAALRESFDDAERRLVS